MTWSYISIIDFGSDFLHFVGLCWHCAQSMAEQISPMAWARNDSSLLISLLSWRHLLRLYSLSTRSCCSLWLQEVPLLVCSTLLDLWLEPLSTSVPYTTHNLFRFCHALARIRPRAGPKYQAWFARTGRTLLILWLTPGSLDNPWNTSRSWTSQSSAQIDFPAAPGHRVFQTLSSLADFALSAQSASSTQPLLPWRQLLVSSAGSTAWQCPACCCQTNCLRSFLACVLWRTQTHLSS